MGAVSTVKTKPKLPRELYRASTLGSLGFIAVSMAFHYGGGLGIYLALSSGMAWWLAAPLVVVSTLVAGQGLHLYGWIGHQAFHGNLFRTKKASILGGVAVSATIPGVFCVVGYYAGHWNHHLFTNTDRDPDVNLHSYRSIWSKLFVLRFLQNGVFRSQTVTLARGKELPFASRLPFKPRDVISLARFNLALCLAVLAAHVAFIVVWPLLGVSLFVIPLAGGFLVSGPRPFVEHGGLEAGEGVDARTRASVWATWFYFWNNYHLEHHLYPSVPCYKLGRVHRLLRESGYFEEHRSPVEPTLAGGLRHMFARYPAGEPPEAGAAVTTDEMQHAAADDRLSPARPSVQRT